MMATLSTPPRESDVRDSQNISDSTPLDAPVESQINGISTQHNAIPEFAHPPMSNGDKLVVESHAPTLDPTPPTSAEDGQTVVVKAALPPPSETAVTDDNLTPPVLPTITQAVTTGTSPPTLQTQPSEEVSHVAETVVTEQPPIVDELPHSASLPEDSTPDVATSVEAPNDTTTEIIVSQIPTTASDVAPITEAVPAYTPTKAEEGVSQVVTSEPVSIVETTSVVAQPDEDQVMVDAEPPSGKIAREREEEEDEQAPDAKRARTEADVAVDSTTAVTESVPNPPLIDTNAVTEVPQVQSPTLSSAPSNVDFGPEMTEPQRMALSEALKNLKKNKAAVPFSKPVDAHALGIPQYYDIIAQPMDLSTMETKLKNKEYGSVQDYINDFDLIVNNAVKFNGEGHAVASAGRNLQAQFRKGLEDRIPRAGEASRVPPPKKQQNLSLATTRETNKRRQSQPSVTVPTPTTAVSETVAVGEYGVPQIRRQSSTQDGRPKREIHKPPPKDLIYTQAKQRKKKHQAELKFCDHVLEVLKSPKYVHIAQPFQQPVDPVALNIPDYHKFIKHPMDLGTVAQRQASNQYDNAQEFHKDVSLIFQNCKSFNPVGNPVRDMGDKYEKVFEKLWATKDDWVATHTQPSGPQSPEVDSDEDEDDEDDEEDDTAAQIQKLNEQIAILSAQAQSLIQSSAKKAKGKSAGAKKGAKSTKPTGASKGGRKSGSLGGSSSWTAKPEKKAPKPKAPKVKAVTNAQKQEISQKIGNLPAEQISKAADWIKTGLRADGLYDLAARAEDDLEFDIDQINNDVLHKLLRLCRQYDPPDATQADDSDSKGRSPAVSRSKKSKPMSKSEQEQQINALKDKLSTFQGPQSSASPDLVTKQDSSDDESESASESEED